MQKAIDGVVNVWISMQGGGGGGQAGRRKKDDLLASSELTLAESLTRMFRKKNTLRNCPVQQARKKKKRHCAVVFIMVSLS